MNPFLQILNTGGGKDSYRPLGSNLTVNLKRRGIWPCFEAHIVYAVIYTMCTNKEGFLLLKTYFLHVDKHIFDPYSIGQYLLVPVNTIVKSLLLPWMLEAYEDLCPGENCNGKKTKAETFLKYTLLSDLMKIVHRYGRHPNYDFDNDERLSKILNGKHGQEGKMDKNHVTGAFDSFLTIWLLTLPEKFKEWYDIHNIHNKDNKKSYPATKVMNYNEIALFPRFAAGDSSTLYVHPQQKNL